VAGCNAFSENFSVFLKILKKVAFAPIELMGEGLSQI
jgi:hypothetical protein